MGAHLLWNVFEAVQKEARVLSGLNARFLNSTSHLRDEKALYGIYNRPAQKITRKTDSVSKQGQL